ncbi:MAG: protease complex subunit PrcB family protein, partial [Candidatus Limnocylindria bacterium]
LVLLVSCGSNAGSGGADGTVKNISFTEIASGSYGRHDTGPAIVVGANDQWRATLMRLIDDVNIPDGRVGVAAFQGQQRSGGFAIRIERIERDGDRLIVRARFSEPKPDDIVTMALTSPVHVVSIAVADAKDLKGAVLLDSDGAERAKASLT